MPTAETATKVVAVSVSVSGGSIVCSPDPVQVKSCDTTLKFTVATPGYKFRAENAIVVTNGGSEFPQPSQTSADGLTATLEDCCDQRGSYKYSVYLKDASGRIVMVDPDISNEPQ